MNLSIVLDLVVASTVEWVDFMVEWVEWVEWALADLDLGLVDQDLDLVDLGLDLVVRSSVHFSSHFFMGVMVMVILTTVLQDIIVLPLITTKNVKIKKYKKRRLINLLFFYSDIVE
jgi:hypothetical protein